MTSTEKEATIEEQTDETIEENETEPLNTNDEVEEITEHDEMPDVEIEFPLDMSESDVQDAIHAMSHQKVAADKKWSFKLLTQERVARLIEVVEANQYEHVDGYLDILYRWRDKNFSRAHHDHNFVWGLQNGTVGKATGLLSAEEERAFIEEQMPSEEPKIEETDEDTL